MKESHKKAFSSDKFIMKRMNAANYKQKNKIIHSIKSHPHVSSMSEASRTTANKLQGKGDSHLLHIISVEVVTLLAPVNPCALRVHSVAAEFEPR